MSERDRSQRLATIAVGGAGAAVFLAFLVYGLVQQAGYNQYSQSQATDNTSHAADEAKQACAGLSTAELAKCKAKAEAEYQLKANAGRRDYTDLIAQRKSALWAMIMGIAALIGMVLSAVGVILVKQTFDETQRTNKINMRENARSTRRAIAASEETAQAIAATYRQAMATSRAVTMASDGNRIAREAMERELRAYVFVGKPIITYQVFMDGEINDTAKIVLMITNHGRTPAYKVRLCVNAFIHGIWNEPFVSNFEKTHVVHLGEIPPGEKKERPGFTVQGIKGNHRELSDGNRSVMVDGVINYEDAFGKPHATRFRYASTDQEYDNSQWSETPEGNAST